jgi:hypothetical protein
LWDEKWIDVASGGHLFVSGEVSRLFGSLHFGLEAADPVPGRRQVADSRQRQRCSCHHGGGATPWWQGHAAIDANNLGA